MQAIPILLAMFKANTFFSLFQVSLILLLSSSFIIPASWLPPQLTFYFLVAFIFNF
jgi:hypothetical protein